MNKRQAVFLTIIVVGIVAIVISLVSIFKEAQQLASLWSRDTTSFGIVAGSVPTPSPTRPASIPPADDSFNGSRNLFAENCISCHGDNGQGSAIAPPLNTPSLRKTDSDTLQNTITFGRPGTAMPAWGKKAGGPASLCRDARR